MQDAKDIQNTCFKLNSLQLQTLLAAYLYGNNEPHIPPVSTLGVFLHSSHASVLVFFPLLANIIVMLLLRQILAQDF